MYLSDASGTLQVMIPSQDRNCQKYIDDPCREWYSGQWRTKGQIEKIREQRLTQYHRRYANDQEYRERKKKWERERYANDPELRERKKRLERKRNHESRIQIRVGGIRFNYQVDPEKKEALKQQLAEFRAQQATNYRRAADGGFNETVA